MRRPEPVGKTVRTPEVPQVGGVWADIVRDRWPDADVVAVPPDDVAEGYAVVSFCGRYPRVVVHETRAGALADFHMIEPANRDSVLEGVGCSRWCYGEHAIVDLSGEYAALQNLRGAA